MMKKTMERIISQHGENLLVIFPHATERDPVELCKKLRKLERTGAGLALRLCNGPEYPPEGPNSYESRSAGLITRVNKLLGNVKVPIFHNGDPRGYAIKIHNDYVRKHNLNIHRDWGGYGIIAPDFSEEE